jgi:hypothetical protein
MPLTIQTETNCTYQWPSTLQTWSKYEHQASTLDKCLPECLPQEPLAQKAPIEKQYLDSVLSYISRQDIKRTSKLPPSICITFLWLSKWHPCCLYDMCWGQENSCNWSIQYKNKTVFPVKYELRLKEQNVYPTYKKTQSMTTFHQTWVPKKLDTRLPFSSVCLCWKLN